MRIHDFDICALREARQRLMSVLGYYYGDRELRCFTRRLETAIGKLDALIALAENSKKEGAE